MLIAIIPVIVCLLGLLLYALASNPKVAELGRLAFVCGLFVTVYVASRQTLRLP